MEAPETRYARTADGLRIAYQVAGDGPIDIAYAAPLLCTDVMWDEPSYNAALTRLAQMGRLICVSLRGFGASDPIANESWGSDEWMDDIRVILADVGSTQVVVVAEGTTGPGALTVVATYPELVSSLVLINASARLGLDGDNAVGVSATQYERLAAEIEDRWGTGFFGSFLAPSRAGDASFERWHARLEREAQSQTAFKRMARSTANLDTRAVLSTVRVPTLVMHRRDCVFPLLEFGRYLAEHIPNATFKEFPGTDTYLFTQDADAMLDEIEEFITGARPALKHDRALATVLFTDIVSSTDRAARLGDRAWTRLLSQHDALVDGELVRHRGRKVNPTGDGMLATFDGPARAIRCAQSIVEAVRPLGIEVRAGLHTGEVELRGDDIGGIAVHIGQRVSALADAGEILVSRTVTDLVAGSGLEFEERGEHELKGVPGKWAIYAVR